MRAVYCANTDVQALENLNDLIISGEINILILSNLGLNYWGELSCFFKYPEAIKLLINISNLYHKSYKILNSKIKRKTKTKGTFAK